MRRKDIEKLAKIAEIKVAQRQGSLFPFSTAMQRIRQRIAELDGPAPSVPTSDINLQAFTKHEQWKVAERKALEIDHAVVKEEARVFEQALIREQARLQVLEKLAETVHEAARQKQASQANNQVP